MEELAKLAKLTFNVPYVDYTITVHSATILTSWAVMALMFIVGWLSVRHLKQIPDRRQVVLEMLIRSFDETIRESIGEDGRKFIPFIATLFVYILLSNWASHSQGAVAHSRPQYLSGAGSAGSDCSSYLCYKKKGPF